MGDGSRGAGQLSKLGGGRWLSALSPAFSGAGRGRWAGGRVACGWVQCGVGANGSVMRAEAAALSFAEFSVKCRIGAELLFVT